jgi:hypothetical protein
MNQKMSANNEPPEIKSFEALGVLMWSMNSRLADLERAAANGATHADVAGLRSDVAGLMTRQTKVEHDLASAKEEWNRSKPSTLFSNTVKVAAGFAVIVSVLGVLWQVADALTAVKKAALQVQAKP